MKNLTFDKAIAMYEAAKNERQEWETEWKDISEYLLPGRGMYTTTRPDKRRLYSPAVINTVGADALDVLVSGMHGGLTSPALPWFRLEWMDPRISSFEPLKQWLEDCNNKLHMALQLSNFYSVIASFYTEYCGFGTGCIYLGEDTFDEAVPFRWELLTAGEYAFSVDAVGKMNTFYRIIHRSPQQLVDAYGSKVSERIKRYVDEDLADRNVPFVPLLEIIIRERFMDKEVSRYVFEYYGSRQDGREPLVRDGFYEFPYKVARWSTIGSDIYGLGPGARALPDIKRLQEMEKSFLMAVHKTVDPPVNAPAHMRGKLRTLPGSENYYRNPNEMIKELYQVRFDLAGVTEAIARVEQRIQRNFYNDVFLTVARDPNASPYKAAEVAAREQEKMIRLSPVIERLQNEFFQPLIERAFNIMLRKDMFFPLSPDMAAIAGDFRIALISPLAAAQRGVALQGINSFMAFIGGAAQFDQTILDNINVDEAARVYADITGVQLGVLRPQEEVDKIRQARAQQMQEEKMKQEALIAMQAQSQMDANQASAMQAQAQAGLTLAETQQLNQQLGVL